MKIGARVTNIVSIGSDINPHDLVGTVIAIEQAWLCTPGRSDRMVNDYVVQWDNGTTSKHIKRSIQRI